MKLRHWLMVANLIGWLSLSGVVQAANPADTTSLFRYCPELYQYAYDGGPWHLLAIKPLKGDWHLMAFNWNAENGQKRELEFSLTKRFPEVGLQVAAIVDNCSGGSDNTKLMVDWASGSVALGALLPISGDTPLKVGPRLAIGNVTAYATLAESGCEPARVGVSYLPGNAKLEVAHGGETYYFRASKRNGHFNYELRTRFTEDEAFIGFSLTYYPG